MKECILFVMVIILLAGLCACNASPSEDTTLSTEPKEPAPDSLELLAVESLDGDRPGGVGAIVIYEDGERVIFYTHYGLFAYDLAEKCMIFSVDFIKAYGVEGAVQGDTGTYAAASPDGMKIVLHYIDDPEREEKYDAYYIDVATMTWKTGQFRDMSACFDRDLVEGEVIPGGNIKGTCYRRNGETWDVFAEYFK